MRARTWGLLAGSFLALSVLTGGCDKPSESECKKAAENMIRINELEGKTLPIDTNAFARKCRAQFSSKDIECVRKANDRATLDACFPPENKEAPKDAAPK